MVGDAKNEPPRTAKTFTAQIFILNHPTGVRVGYTPIVSVHTSHFAAKLSEI